MATLSAWIARANAFVAGDTLRAYQSWVLRDGTLTAPCPISGAPCRCIACDAHPALWTAYVFEGVEPFGLVTNQTGRGCALALLVRPRGWIPLLDGKDLPKDLDITTMLPEALNHPLDRDAPPRATVGHMNFAHGIWNEFPALRAAADMGLIEELKIRFDPLGVFQRYAERAGLRHGRVADLETGYGWQDRIVTHLTGLYCDHESSALVSELALDRASHVDGDRPAIYLTLRAERRTMRNFEPFAVAVADALRRMEPRVRFLLDAFSVPEDFERSDYDFARTMTDRILRHSRALSDRVAATLRDRGHAVEDLTGLPFRAALLRIGEARFYVSHSGSWHHKIGWIFPTPGVVHGNPANLGRAGLEAHAAQVAVTRLPRMLPRDLVEVSGVSGQDRDWPWDDDYRVRDVQAAAAFVARMYDLEARTAASGPDGRSGRPGKGASSQD